MSEVGKKVSEEELEKQYADYRAQFEQWKESNKGSVGTDAYNQYVHQFEQWEREVEARKAQQMKHRKVIDKEAEAAAVYAQSQQAYMSHHLKAMEQQEMQQRAAAAAAVAAVQQQQMMQNMMMRQTAEQAAPQTERDLFIRFMMGGYDGPPIWGNSKPTYDQRDPLFAKWGERAAPAYHKADTEQQIIIAK
ncbi:CRE-SUT-1 protein [Caenorhabditis remanei]|uniref:CRE-SUT-1 protein n=1 Tax=Caenorhabditis remanei TaxID=31234 RepID=E3MDS2_CAERE|nr:CRE-SUT-1 protein [Caenorhabditis remanei]